MLDVSEDGLRFRASFPIDAGGPIPFFFTAHSNQIEGVGELVWIDQARKTGGLKFTQLAAEAREQIRSWPSDPNLRPSVGEDFSLHVYAQEEPAVSSRWDWRAAVAAFTDGARGAGLRAKPVAARVRQTLSGMMDSARAEFRLLRPRDNFAHSPRIVGTAGALLGVIVILSFSFTHRGQAGQSLIWLGTRIAGTGHPTTPAPAADSQALPAANLADSRAAAETPAPVTASTQPVAPSVAIPATSSSSAFQSPATQAPNALPSRRDAARSNAAPASAAGTELLVQVAAMRQESEARDLAETLRRENFAASVRTLSVDSLYRVVVGPFADKIPALSTREKLKRAGFPAFIRRELATELSDLRDTRPANF